MLTFIVKRLPTLQTEVLTSEMLIISHLPVEAGPDFAKRQRSGSQLPIFRTGVCLAIPNITLVPALEAIQQALNKAVECVVSVSKGVKQWSKERISKVAITTMAYTNTLDYSVCTTTLVTICKMFGKFFSWNDLEHYLSLP